MTDQRHADFSPDRVYRYTLTVRWGEGPACVFLMLNPSTATEVVNDPTVSRCLRYARDWGYPALTVLNLFALRSTDPRALRAHPDPVGPENDRWLDDLTAFAGVVVCAWGEHGALRGRAGAVLARLRERGVAPYRLAVNRSGQPRHPLYCLAELTPLPL